jgi:acetoin utilization deacetylase AcuC-like enzyme
VWHRDNAYHPEQPERISACVQALLSPSSGLVGNVELIDIAPKEYDKNTIPPVNLLAAAADEASSSACGNIQYEPFDNDNDDAALDYAQRVLQATHAPEMVTKLAHISRQAKQVRLDQGKESTLGHMGRIDFDTYLTTETYNVCLRAMCAWIRAVDMAMKNSSRSKGEGAATTTTDAATSAQTIIPFCLTRPPGHHATYNQSNGFCIFNFAAAAAMHVLMMQSSSPKNNKPFKVSIIDWDVHYGQGTADIVMRHEGMRYVSIHQTPAFPYLGESNAILSSAPYRNVCTIPMPPDTTWTCGYESLWEQALDFCAKPGEWEPDVVIVSAGYDALSSDELASCSLTAEDFGKMTRRLQQHLAKACSTKPRPPALLFGLEGGYQLRDVGSGGNLPQAVIATLRALVRPQETLD